MTDIIQGTGVPKLILGQKLYIPCRQNIVVEAIIEELHDIYIGADIGPEKAVWHHYDVDGANEAYMGETPVALEDLSKLELHNQFPWTSFPTWGHAAYIGDDAFISLKEARERIQPSNKKHLARRMKQATKWFRKDFPHSPKLKEHKIYVRSY